MHALYFCNRAGIVPPAWVREAFCAAYVKVAAAKVRSWDEAFGKPYPKNAKLTGLQSSKRRYEVASWIDRLPEQRRNGALREGGDLYGLAAEKLGMGRTVCIDLARMEREECEALLDEAGEAGGAVGFEIRGKRFLLSFKPSVALVQRTTASQCEFSASQRC